MVEPIYIVASGLGIAFMLGLLKKAGKNIAGFAMLLTLAFMAFVSGQWLVSLLFEGGTPQYTYTAGFKPPFSINLLMGKMEAFFTTLINAIGLLGGLYLLDRLKKQGVNAMIVYLLLFVGLNVVVMTRDIFNLFVFLEVSSVAIVGLVLLDRETKAMTAGFKYLIASGIISGLLLIGIIFLYQYAGSLYIDDIVEGVYRTAEQIAVANPDWIGSAPDPGSSAAPYRIYNIGNNQPVRLNRFIEVIEQAVGREAQKNLLPMQPGDVPATYADIEALEVAVGFRPATPIETGVQQFVDWYREYYAV